MPRITRRGEAAGRVVLGAGLCWFAHRSVSARNVAASDGTASESARNAGTLIDVTAASQRQRIGSVGTVARLPKMLLAMAAVLTGAAGVAAVGTYANWHKSVTATQNVTVGTFGISLPTGSTTNQFPVTATNVVPGDAIARLADVSNTGNTPWATFTLNPTSTVTGARTLHDGTVNALTVTVYECAVAWTTVDPTTGCTPSNKTTPVATVALTGANTFDLHTLNAPTLTNGNVDHLLVVTGYPTTANDYADYNSLTDTITYTFSATQRAGTSK